ncbi:MAG: alpha/beta fold hydrolase [Parvibaculum sp.]|nr:alpha/beta fold hydrolase [Parvibaculum sp.]
MLKGKKKTAAHPDAALAQRGGAKVHFDHTDMDYYLSWILGRHFAEGADAEECMEVARGVADGDPASWQAAWPKLGERLERAAQADLDAGRREEARRAWLRASTAFRAPLFIMSANDERLMPLAIRMRDCFRRAAALFDPPIEPVAVPFRGAVLDGYFHKADASGGRRPLLIVVGGIETFAEDCWFMLGGEAARRGWHLLAIDLPGQGTTPAAGLHFEARMGPAVAAVLDHALARPDVDPARVALYGFSWGGHVVFKGAERETRLAALIANPAMPDVFRAARAQQNNRVMGDPVGRQVFEQIVWRFGLALSFRPSILRKRFAKVIDYLRHGKAKLRTLSCPVLCLAGEAEAPITLEIARGLKRKLRNRKSRVVVFTATEGGAAHCQVDNLALPAHAIFDWLEEVAPRGRG